MQVLGVILAGGASSRMGKPKPLVKLREKTLIWHVIRGLAPQVNDLLVSGPEDFGSGLPFAPDRRISHPGPLAGIEAALYWLRKNKPDFTGIVTAPVDGPYLDIALVKKLTASGKPALAICQGRRQPTYGFWPAGLGDDIVKFLDDSPRLSLIAWAEHVGAKTVEFENAKSFININDPEELSKLE